MLWSSSERSVPKGRLSLSLRTPLSNGLPITYMHHRLHVSEVSVFILSNLGGGNCWSGQGVLIV